MTTINVLHISDSHVVAAAPPGPPVSLAGGVEALGGVSTASLFERVLQTATSTHEVDVIIHTGDLVDDADPASYRLADSLLDATGLAYDVCPGNHDDPEKLARHLRVDGNPVRSVEVASWRFVMVNSAVLGLEHGRLGPDTREQLREVLSGPAKPTLVAMHHPPLSMCTDDDCRIEDSASLVDDIVSSGMVRVVLTGHLHHAGRIDHGGVAWLLGPSAALQLDHVHPLQDNNQRVTAVGARVIRLGHDGTFTESLVWC